MAKEEHLCDFESYMEDQQEAVHIDSEERYLYLAILRQSGKQHIQLNMDLYNNYFIINDLYHKSRPQNIHLLEKYSKIDVPKILAPEGLSFAQGDSNQFNG